MKKLLSFPSPPKANHKLLILHLSTDSTANGVEVSKWGAVEVIVNGAPWRLVTTDQNILNHRHASQMIPYWIYCIMKKNIQAKIKWGS